MSKKLKWGILGTGNIAQIFTEGIKKSKTGELVAIASRRKETARQFSHKNKVNKYYVGYNKLLENKEIDIVYIALPHPLHAEWSIKAANNNKHVLCEKPMAMNYKEAVSVIAAVKENNVFFMEGMMFRCHPQTTKLTEILKNNIIGDVGVVSATFSYNADPITSPQSYDKQLGAGAIMDVGCYAVSMARLIAGAVQGESFLNPIDVKGVAVIRHDSKVDEYSIGTLKFENGIIAQISTGIHIDQENSVRIYGSKGEIYIKSPWVPGGREPGETNILYRNSRYGDYNEIVAKSDWNLYSLEVDHINENIRNKQSSAISWEDSLGNIRVLDAWRVEVGVQY